MRSLRNGKRDKVLMCARGKNTVKPGLFVLVPRGGESCAGEFFSVQSEGGLLRGISVGGQGT